MTDDGDQVAVTACLYPDDAEAVVGVLKGHTLNKAASGRFRLNKVA